MMTAEELTGILAAEGVMDPLPRFDSVYAAPTRRFVEGEFSRDLARVERDLGVSEYQPEKGDCDKFARRAAYWMMEWSEKTTANTGAGIAFGVFLYARDAGGGHAINCFPENGRLVFYEPQTKRVVELSEAERRSGMAII